jgi:hypothetical protein
MENTAYDRPIPEQEADPLSKPGEPRYYMAVGTEQIANEAFGDFGRGDPATLELKVNALFDVLNYDQRARVLGKLGFKPVKKFYDETSGLIIKCHRFYGFWDAGGVAGTPEGYATQEDAVAAMAELCDGDYSTEAAELGSISLCILSGEAFIAQLQKVDRVSAYGRMV